MNFDGSGIFLFVIFRPCLTRACAHACRQKIRKILRYIIYIYLHYLSIRGIILFKQIKQKCLTKQKH